jgi:hypothetical protein
VACGQPLTLPGTRESARPPVTGWFRATAACRVGKPRTTGPVSSCHSPTWPERQQPAWRGPSIFEIQVCSGDLPPTSRTNNINYFSSASAAPIAQDFTEEQPTLPSQVQSGTQDRLRTRSPSLRLVVSDHSAIHTDKTDQFECSALATGTYLSGRLSAMKPLRFGICTCGSVRASSTASAATIFASERM